MQIQQAELAAAKHLFRTFSSPCFRVKIDYSYRFISTDTEPLKLIVKNDFDAKTGV
jgi:hypothetical protein